MKHRSPQATERSNPAIPRSRQLLQPIATAQLAGDQGGPLSPIPLALERHSWLAWLYLTERSRVLGCAEWEGLLNNASVALSVNRVNYTCENAAAHFFPERAKM